MTSTYRPSGSTFDESKFNRQADGRFGAKVHDEADVEGMGLTRIASGVQQLDSAAVLNATAADLLQADSWVSLSNADRSLDATGAIDYLEIRRGTDPTSVAHSAVAKVVINETLLRSVASTVGEGEDSDWDDDEGWAADEEAALDWLNRHSEDLERVLVEDHGARLDVAHDEWDDQAVEIERPMPADYTVSDVLGETCGDLRAAPLHAMIRTGDFGPLIEQVEHHAADRQTTRNLGVQVLDHLTNTVGNEQAERARYAALRTRWSTDPATGATIASVEVTALDSDAEPLTDPFIVPVGEQGLFRRNRVPSDMGVHADDPNERDVLRHAQGPRSMIDLDRAGANTWGKAKP